MTRLDTCSAPASGSCSIKRTIPVRALIVVSIIGCLFWMRRPVADFRMKLEGYAVTADQFAKTLKIDRPGATANVAFQIQNLTNERVCIVGLETSCSCLSATELPLEIPPRQGRSLTFAIKSNTLWAGKQVTQHARLLLDVPSPSIQLEINTQVAAPDPAGHPES